MVLRTPPCLLKSANESSAISECLFSVASRSCRMVVHVDAELARRCTREMGLCDGSYGLRSAASRTGYHSSSSFSSRSLALSSMAVLFGAHEP